MICQIELTHQYPHALLKRYEAVDVLIIMRHQLLASRCHGAAMLHHRPIIAVRAPSHHRIHHHPIIHHLTHHIIAALMHHHAAIASSR
jgi:hypothetical protein